MSAPRERPTPRSLGYRMPAEWEPHAATWIAWPHETSDWPGKFSVIPGIYAEIVRVLAESERVEVLVADARTATRARRTLERNSVDLARVGLHVCATDRSWTRDSAPSFVRKDPAIGSGRGEIGLVHWKFNAWARYDNWQADRKVPRFVARRLARPLWRAEIDRRWVVLEGGAFDVNGSGLVLATEECLLEGPPWRNPGLAREAYERLFSEYLGADQVVWLPRGIEGDDTHGHVDDLARFVGPRRVVAIAQEDPKDPDFAVTRDSLAVLRAARPRSGARLEVRPLPCPRPVRFSGRRLPASYANFYVANRSVLVPTFNDPHDPEAMDVLRHCFPGREVVGIPARDLVWGLGTIHCLTQQQPAEDASRPRGPRSPSPAPRAAPPGPRSEK